MKSRLPILLLLALTVLPLGCSRRDTAPLKTPTGPVAANLNTNEVVIGQPFTLTAMIQAQPTDRIDWPAPGAPPALMMRNTRERTKGIPDGYRAQEWDLIALRPGTLPAWTGVIARTDAEGKQLRIEVPRVEVRVNTSLKPGDEALRDITGLQQWPRRVATRLLLALGMVALLALAGALLARHLLKQRTTPVVAPPPIPPHERALRALRALREKGWPDTAGVKTFYIELSGIVRAYVEGAFRLRAPEQTTEEFIRSATTSRLLNPDHQQLVTAFLEQSDLVKFARHQPAQTDMEAALTAAERLVVETRPTPQPTSTTPPATPS